MCMCLHYNDVVLMYVSLDMVSTVQLTKTENGVKRNIDDVSFNVIGCLLE